APERTQGQLRTPRTSATSLVRCRLGAGSPPSGAPSRHGNDRRLWPAVFQLSLSLRLVSFRFVSLAISARRQEDVGIQDTGGVERGFDAAKGPYLGLAAVEMEPGSFRRSDAVLGADAAAEFGGKDQHAIIHRLVIRIDAGDIHVDISVSDMAEQPGGGSRVGVAHDV